MPLKDLLVCFDRTDAGYARLELAFNLARACRAYLAGAYVLPEAGSGGFGLARPAGMAGLAEDGVSSGGVASGALHDALLFFADAAATVVFVGSRERDLTQHRPALDRVVHHLHHHGVAGKPEETLRGGLAVSDILLSRAADLAADMIVSGGYHHSPLREALLGGVSRELLQHMTVPVLMSH
jgi:nucleotide-binding universal stress UspA family protein